MSSLPIVESPTEEWFFFYSVVATVTSLKWQTDDNATIYDWHLYLHTSCFQCWRESWDMGGFSLPDLLSASAQAGISEVHSHSWGPAGSPTALGSNMSMEMIDIANIILFLWILCDSWKVCLHAREDQNVSLKSWNYYYRYSNDRNNFRQP